MKRKDTVDTSRQNVLLLHLGFFQRKHNKGFASKSKQHEYHELAATLARILVRCHARMRYLRPENGDVASSSF